MSWQKDAICVNDANPSYWVSYNLDKVRYAKDGCSRCSVHKECIQASLMQDEDPVGVIAGLSEFDRLNKKWKKVSDSNGSNWH